MAPEQLESKEADARTDIFAFGATLYEMVTGRRAFEGKSQATLISAIISSQPPAMATLQPVAPPTLDRVVNTCLAKDPDDRLQTAHDLLLQLQWVIEGGSQAAIAAPVAGRRSRRERLIGALIAAPLAAAIAGLAVWALTPEPSAPHQALRDRPA